jgi:8-amino-7-oxononanoate synthase
MESTMDFAAALAEMERANLRRTLRVVDGAQTPRVRVDGRDMLLFSSNSYLGLAEEPSIRRRAASALEHYGTGSGGSRLVTGNTALHTELEHALARFKGTEDCVLFTSGYTANLGILSALAGAGSHIFSDELNHASIVDGCRLARGAKVIVYRHNDTADLRAKIRAENPAGGIIVTDSVFSMDGDIADLPELVRIKKEHGLLLMVDEAHATGVLGATGRGSAEHFGIPSGDVDVVMGTLSKAVPSEGGFACGSAALCEYLRNRARSFIFTTAGAPAVVGASLGGVEYIAAHPECVARLRENCAFFAERLGALGVPADARTPIFPVVIGSEEAAKRVSDACFAAGIFIPCIRYPTVARGAARLRITLMATHTKEDMDRVVDFLGRFLLSPDRE